MDLTRFWSFLLMLMCRAKFAHHEEKGISVTLKDLAVDVA